MIKVGIVGGTGFIGFDLIKFLLKHKKIEIKIVTSTSVAGKKVQDVFPELNCNLKFSKLSVEDLNKIDVVFLAVPHGKAKPIASKLKCKIIDLSADHRLTHTYGIPEIFKSNIKKSKLIANPGCYATACILAAYPIQNLVKYAVFDCISGYSGGGKNALYDCKENIIAYKITTHQHIEEISKVIDFNFSFTPHVVNAFSGIMCTAHIFLKKKVDIEVIKETYKKFYNRTSTKIVEGVPCTKDVVNTPWCNIGGFEIDKNNQLVIISVIDNLFKGAASQAIENMNILLGFDHKEGLLWKQKL